MLDGSPQVPRDVAMAANLGKQFAITGFVGYKFGCMIASDRPVSYTHLTLPTIYSV